MSKGKDATTKNAATRMLLNLFYEPEYLDNLVAMVKIFDISKQPKSYMADLAELVDVTVEMIEEYTKVRPIIQKKSKRVSTRKKRKDAKKDAEEGESKPEEEETATKEKTAEDDANKTTEEAPKEQTKESSADDLDDIFKESEPVKEVSTQEIQQQAEQDLDDFLKDVEDQQQKEKTFSRLKKKESSEESSQPEAAEKPKKKREEGLTYLKQAINESLDDIVDWDAGSDDDEEEVETTIEKVITLEDYITQFATSTIIYNYCVLLRYYKTNSIATNDQIVRFFDKIVNHTEYEAIFYQVSSSLTFSESNS